MEEEVGKVKRLLSFYLLFLLLFDLSLAEQSVYLADGKVYSVDINRKRHKVIVESPSGKKVGSILALPKTRQLVYTIEERNIEKPSFSLWLGKLDGAGGKELLQIESGKIELCDFSPDEKRVVFQVQRADSFTVCYLNLHSGKFLQLPSAYSPKFLTNTRVLVLAEPSRPGFCYHLLACWDVAKEKLDTLAYTPETCNRVLNISNTRNLLALVRSDAGTQMNEYIDIVDTAGQIAISRAAASSGLIKILGGPDFSPDNKHIAWVAEHWLLVTDLQTKETKRVVERLMTDDFAWSPYGGEILFAFTPTDNPKKCSTCPPNMMRYSPGLFTVNQAGDAFERVALMWGAMKQVFWIK